MEMNYLSTRTNRIAKFSEDPRILNIVACCSEAKAAVDIQGVEKVADQGNYSKRKA